MELTYQQVLADMYDENAKDILVHPKEIDTEDIPADEKFDYEANELSEPEEFNKFHGDRNKPEFIIKSEPKDSSKSSVNHSTQIKNVVLSIDTAFRGNIVPNTTSTLCETGIPAENQITGTSSSNFVFMTSRLFKNISSVKLTSLEFPNVFYTFSKTRGNTNFNLSLQTNTYDPVTGTPIIQPITITINDGNYIDTSNVPMLTAHKLTNTIQNLITNERKGNAPLVNVTYSETSHKVLFSSDNPFSIDFPNSNSNPHRNGIGYNLGFFKLRYVSTYNITTKKYEIVPEVCPDVIQDQYVYIEINDWNLVEHQEYGQTHFAVFARIQLPLSKNTMIFDNNYTNSSSKEYFFEQPVNIQRLEVRVLDAYGNTLDMLNANMSMTLELHQVYDSAVYEKLREL